MMETLSIAPGRCVMVGDSFRDVEAGKNAGVATVLVTAQTREHDLQPAIDAGPDFTCEGLPDAVEWILNRVGCSG